MVQRVKVRKEYRGLSKAQLLDEAYELGVEYEMASHSCSQSTVKALQVILGFKDVLVKASTSLCAGTAFQLVGTCGGLAGGIMVLDYYFGRPAAKMSVHGVAKENTHLVLTAQATARLLCNKFIEEYGTITCAQIMAQIFGRLYYLEDPDELQKFENAGGHTDRHKCPQVVGKASRWVMEILTNKGIVDMPQSVDCAEWEE